MRNLSRKALPENARAIALAGHTLTNMGILRHPADFKILVSCLTVFSNTLGGHISILVMTTRTGTPSANDKPRCSLVMPTIPALEPIMSITKSGAHPVIPNTVV